MRTEGNKIYIINKGKKASVHSKFVNFYVEKKVYIYKEVNIRDYNGNLLYLAKSGRKLEGEELGYKIRLTARDSKNKEEIPVYAHKTFVAEEGFTKT